MSVYGLRVWQDGLLVYDTPTVGIGCIIDIVVYTGTAAPTRTYESYFGFTVAALLLSQSASVSISSAPTIDYALGYPRIVFPPGESGQTFHYAVFAK